MPIFGRFTQRAQRAVAAAQQLSKLGNTCASMSRMAPCKADDGKPVRKRVAMRIDVATEVVADPAPLAP